MTTTSATVHRPDVDHAEVARARFWSSLIPGVLELISDDVVVEHRDQPIGQHGDRLSRLLTHLRTIPGLARLAILTMPDGSFALGAIDPDRGRSPVPLDGRRFATIDAAEHAVFLARIAALRDRPEATR